MSVYEEEYSAPCPRIEALKKEIDPCEMNIGGLCPMSAGPIDVPKAQIDVPQDVVNSIPGGYRLLCSGTVIVANVIA